MVLFEVHLINAETEEPFKEHLDPNDVIHFEVEPDAQYWVRLISYLPPKQRCRCQIDIDGTSLGYHVYLKGTECQDVGIWSRTQQQGGVQQQEIHKALQFETLKVDKRLQPMSTRPWMGRIRVRFYEVIVNDNNNNNNNNNNGTISSTQKKDFDNHWNGGRKVPRRCMMGAKHSVSSKMGTMTKTFHETSNLTRNNKKDKQQNHHHRQQASGSSCHRQRGPLLQSLQLRYSTAHGLIVSDFLNNPRRRDQCWAYHRILHPIHNNNNYVDPSSRHDDDDDDGGGGDHHPPPPPPPANWHNNPKLVRVTERRLIVSGSNDNVSEEVTEKTCDLFDLI